MTETFPIKTMLEEKTVIVEHGESQLNAVKNLTI
jgi:hypothetical protein